MIQGIIFTITIRDGTINYLFVCLFVTQDCGSFHQSSTSKCDMRALYHHTLMYWVDWGTINTCTCVLMYQNFMSGISLNNNLNLVIIMNKLGRTNSYYKTFPMDILYVGIWKVI